MAKQKRRPQLLKSQLPSADLDIVIPVYGQPELLKKCLAAVQATCFNLNYHLIVVDDKSLQPNDMTVVYVTLPKNATLIRNSINGGFPRTANIGAAAGQAPAILFLNTDVTVQSGCIGRMLDTINEAPATLPHNKYFDKEYVDAPAGIVAPKLLFSEDSPHLGVIPGKIQHAGMAFNIKGEPIHRCLNWAADHERVSTRRSMQIMTGACLMTKRTVWTSAWATYQKNGDTTGGAFNEVYGRGTYEDLEFCLAARGFGHKVIYEPAAVATHTVGGSSVLQGRGYNLERNHSIFKARCGDLILWDDWCYW